jgi:hypothetical protein
LNQKKANHDQFYGVEIAEYVNQVHENIYGRVGSVRFHHSNRFGAFRLGGHRCVGCVLRLVRRFVRTLKFLADALFEGAFLERTPSLGRIDARGSINTA